MFILLRQSLSGTGGRKQKLKMVLSRGHLQYQLYSILECGFILTLNMYVTGSFGDLNKVKLLNGALIEANRMDSIV